MRKIILLFAVFALVLTPADAKINFGTFMKKGLGKAIKESKEKGATAAAVSTLENEDSNDELDPEDIRNFYVKMDDNKYEWTQSKSKKSAVLMSTDGLMIQNMQSYEQSKSAISASISTVELPIMVESDDFTYGVVTTPIKLKDNICLMLIFDYQDDRNFKTVVLDDSQYKYMVIDNGVPNTVKTGLVKYPPKATMHTFYIQREGSIVKFFLNDIEYGVFKNVVISNPTFGVGVLGKAKVTVLRMIFDVITNENALEESTTQNG